MKTKLFRADPHYLDILQSFTVPDALMALGYYLVILIVYYCTGSIMARTGKYYGVFVNIALMLIPVMICRKMSSIGLCKRNLKRSLLVSGMIGILFLLISTIIPGISSGAKLLPLKKIASNVIYFFVVIALSEEISFRGYIQPRLYPLVKREWLAVLFGGLLFVFMHYPYQMAARGMTAAQYWPQFIASAPFQFFWHLVFTILYRRYGNIYGSTVLHGLVDLSGGIFA